MFKQQKTLNLFRSLTALLIAFNLVGVAARSLAQEAASPVPLAFPAPWIQVMSEGFEGTWPSTGWTLIDESVGDEHLWGKDGSLVHGGSNAVWAARGGANGILPTLGYYPDWTASVMRYGPFDLSDASEAVLEFYYDHESPDGEDFFCWQASSDGTNFYNGNCVSGDHKGYNYQTFDLTSVSTVGDLTGDSSVWIQFRFNSGEFNNAKQGPWVDDVKLWKYPAQTLVINEVDAGSEDRIEIYNSGPQAVVMDGMDLKIYDDYNGLAQSYTITTFTLSAGSYVVLHEGTGSNDAANIYIGGSNWWNPGHKGAVSIQMSDSTGLDFVRWAGSTVTPPSGTSWTGTNPPSQTSGRTLGRDPNGIDTDDGDDWCLQLPSLGSANTGCAYEGIIRINEVDVGGDFLNTNGAIEIYNGAGQSVVMTGWHVILYGDGGAVDDDYVIPTFTLGAASYVVIHEGTGSNSATDLYTGNTITWDIYSNGAVALTNGTTGIDFVRWGDSTVTPPSGTTWTGTKLPIPGLSNVLGRDASSTDTDNSSDWCLQSATLGSQNGGCSATASIGNLVWNDLDQDGIQDEGEPGVAGVAVELWQASKLDETTTASDGSFSFSGLTPGDYHLEFIKPDGSWTFSPQDQGVDDAVDSDANTSTGQTTTTSLISGENDLSWDAGMFQPSAASIGDFVWNDLNQNGIQDEGEPGLAGVAVELWQASKVDETTTASDGSFIFVGLTPGEYHLEFIKPDSSWSFSPKDQGGDDTVDSDGDVVTGQTATTTLSAGENDMTWDCGLYLPPGDDTIGVYDPSTGNFLLRNTNDAGAADLDFLFAADITDGIPLGGDWDGDGVDTIGVFSPSLGEFRLRNSNDAGAADITLQHNILKGGQPLVGDWDGDGVDTIGIFLDGKVYMRNANSIGQPDIKFKFGGAGDIPLAGDWNGDGFDTIGVFDPVAGEFQLRNSNSTGPADITLSHNILIGATPITGDWDGDGDDTVGIYIKGKVFMRNTNSIGQPDLKFNYGGAGLLPVTGDWDGG